MEIDEIVNFEGNLRLKVKREFLSYDNVRHGVRKVLSEIFRLEKNIWKMVE